MVQMINSPPSTGTSTARLVVLSLSGNLSQGGEATKTRQCRSSGGMRVLCRVCNWSWGGVTRGWEMQVAAGRGLRDQQLSPEEGGREEGWDMCVL